MIIIQLQGGLSNQLFQYAAARGLAHRLSTEVWLDKRWYDSADQTDGVDVRRYELGGFSFKQRVYEINILPKISRKLHRGAEFNDLDEPHVFHEEFLKLKDYTYLRGFYQNQKYFSDIREILLAEFELSSPPQGKNAILLKQIRDDQNSVGVHIRRGDYATSKSHNKHHGLLGVAYYKAAGKKISETIKNPNFYIFSNDIDWCKKNIELPGKMQFIDHNDPQTGGPEDMRLMKQCRHQIIANSTFSWWSAWLNKNPNKLVVAPKTWLASGAFDTTEVVPDDWIKL